MAYREIVEQIIHYSETQQPTHTIKFTMKIDKKKPVKCELQFKDGECYLRVTSKGYKSKNLYLDITVLGGPPQWAQVRNINDILRLALFDSLNDTYTDCWFDKGVKFSDLNEEQQEEMFSRDVYEDTVEYHTVKVVWDNSWDNELIYNYNDLHRRLSSIIKAYYSGLLDI